MILRYCCLTIAVPFYINFQTKGIDFIITALPIKTQKNYKQYFSFMIDKSHLSEYISSDSSLGKEPCVKEELSNISQEDELVIIKYLLDIMRAHDIITEEEYQAVLYEYS